MSDFNTKNNLGNLDFWVFIAIILFSFALYIYPLKSKSFCFDDHSFIENNQVIKKIDLPGIFNAFNTRSLVGLSFALNYRWCGLNPVGYRFINLLIHCLNAFLVYLLIKSTLNLLLTPRSILFCRLEWLAFLGSLLFLSHPIQTEPVNFITQRFVLLGTFFYLLTLYSYIQYRCTRRKRYWVTAIASSLAAMFCKEFVVTLPVILALYDFYFLDPGNETWWKRCRRLIPFFVMVLVVPLLLLRTPAQAIGVANIAQPTLTKENIIQRGVNHIDITRARGAISRKQYFLTELNVVRTYVRLMFLPVNQNFDYDYPISYVMDAKTAMSGVFLLCLLVLAGVTYKSHRIVSFSIWWFFITLSVESSFIPIGDVIVEYRLYLASAGVVFLVMTLIYLKEENQKKLSMMMIAILIGFSILTFQRNKVWRDELSLWKDTVTKSPHKARPYGNRGVVYLMRGDLTNAMSDFNKAIELKPEFAEAHFNRGLTYEEQNMIPQALSDYNKAIEINSNYVGAYENRGFIYASQGQYSLASVDLNKAIELQPNLAELYNIRGDMYYKQGNMAQALLDFNKAIEINPDYRDAYYNLFVVKRALAH